MLLNRLTAALFWVFPALLWSQSPNFHNLHFNSLPQRWDQALPLGNGMLGALVWQKDQNLHFSLDRADLWDLRPMNGLQRPEFSYQWVQEQIKKGEYEPVQQFLDAPYDREPAPSKIPGGAFELPTQKWGKVQSAHLSADQALCEVHWENGVQLQTYIHATQPIGWFRISNLKDVFKPIFVAPPYQGKTGTSGGPVNGDDLSRLGYPPGILIEDAGMINYLQDGWNGFKYEISIRWKKTKDGAIEGVWSISSEQPKAKMVVSAAKTTELALLRGFDKDLYSHRQWWMDWWAQSSITVPDSTLEKQWYLEQYKFGSATRRGAPPISLQAIWTADNGRLPPWKGDYHHDLNTQLSYWPAYSGNHLTESMAYIDHLEKNKNAYRRYTQRYFGVQGLCVPGVTTLDGAPMGGWIQYALSPTVSAWLAQHYYLQWRYSMDRNFLERKAWPWIKETATFLEKITVVDATGKRKLPISSSPEINDNSLSAWFPQTTNYDLALIKFVFRAAGELGNELGIKSEAEHWRILANEMGDYALTPNKELMFAPSMAYNQSHRHFSHAMAIHPLGLIRWEDGRASQQIIKNTIQQLDSVGPSNWCGYSYAWLANLKARAKDGKGAAEALSIFAKAFCSPNSFHLNGDQTKSGYSSFTYDPFTLEGNFAFAAGLQEMMLQSYAGFIEIMPAVPSSWTEVSFRQLRAEGAFLVSANKSGGQVERIEITSEKGGKTRLKLPFRTYVVERNEGIAFKHAKDGFLDLDCKAKGVIVVKNGYE